MTARANPPSPTPTNNEALEKQIHALVSNLISGQAGVEPLLHTDGVDYIKDIMELIEAYTTKQVIAELERVIRGYHSVNHLMDEQELRDRIAILTSRRM